MKQKQIRIQDYNYELPTELIALYPLPQRDEARVIVYRDGAITEKVFSQVADIIPAETLLVFNDTKVIRARLFFKSGSGATIEIFCLEPVTPFTDLRLAVFVHEPTVWRCMVGNAKRWKGDSLEKFFSIDNSISKLYASLVEKEGETFLIKFEWDNYDFSFASVIETAGLIPLPPYMRREAELKDADSYQTIFGQQDGSVAAPTAGLHFTEEVFESLKQNKIETAFLTLHVGAGTFRPVKTETLEGHQMHGERIYVNRIFIENLLKHISVGKSIAAIGTTSLRTLESLYWFGVKYSLGDKSFELNQWEVYESSISETTMTATEALQSLIKYLDTEGKFELSCTTHLLCAPGYQFRTTDILFTNFHLPQSTLLLLVSAFIGDDWKKVYDFALENRFRFLSYGDTSVLFRK